MIDKEKPDREKALDLFLEHNGNITNRAIAQKLNANEKTVSVWKYRYKWKDKLGCSTDSESKTTTKENDMRKKQREKIINALNAINSYSPALDILIEVYLDCFEEYENAKDKELETESLRKEMARLLGQLGLNISNRLVVNSISKKDGEKEKPENKHQENKLLQFRQRMTK